MLLFANQFHRQSGGRGRAQRPPGTNRRAFTLVELILAMSITVLVAGSTAVILANVSTARQRSEQHLTNNQDTQYALHAIVTSLRNAYRPVDDDTPMLEGIDDWAGDEPADRIRLFTISNRTIRKEQPESDVREVEFFVTMPEDGSTPALMRRTDPTRNELPDEGGVVEQISKNVVSLNIEYHDGEQWQEEWLPNQNRWPLLVRIELGIIVDYERQLLKRVRKTVNFPRWPETRKRDR